METIIHHYDKEYYRGPYDAFLDDPRYGQGIERFSQHATFNEANYPSLLTTAEKM